MTSDLIAELRAAIAGFGPQAVLADKEARALISRAADHIASLEAALKEAIELLETFAPLTDDSSRTRRFLAARALDGGEPR